MYRHWSDASTLVVDAIDALAEPCPAPDTGSLREDLTVIINGLARTLTSSPTAKVMPSIVDAAERDPEIARLRRDWVRQRRTSLVDAIARATERGEITGDVDVELIAAMGSGPLFYRRLVSHEPLSPKFLAGVVDAMLVLLGATP